MDTLPHNLLANLPNPVLASRTLMTSATIYILLLYLYIIFCYLTCMLPKQKPRIFLPFSSCFSLVWLNLETFSTIAWYTCMHISSYERINFFFSPCITMSVMLLVVWSPKSTLNSAILLARL